jgi:hypothetical protein
MTIVTRRHKLSDLKQHMYYLTVKEVRSLKWVSGLKSGMNRQ